MRLINHYERLIRALPEPPILIGYLVRRHRHATPVRLRPWRGLQLPLTPRRLPACWSGGRQSGWTFPVFFSWGKLAPRHDHVAQVLQHALRTDRAAKRRSMPCMTATLSPPRDDSIGKRPDLSRRQDTLGQPWSRTLCYSSAAVST